LIDGQLQLKYTCTRCAVSEPAFLSPMKKASPQLSDMRLTPGKNHHVENQLQNDLVRNATNPDHPYKAKEKDIKATMCRNYDQGFSHVKGDDARLQAHQNTRKVLNELIQKVTQQN